MNTTPLGGQVVTHNVVFVLVFGNICLCSEQRGGSKSLSHTVWSGNGDTTISDNDYIILLTELPQ
jgi:hypothetical protein